MILYVGLGINLLLWLSALVHLLWLWKRYKMLLFRHTSLKLKHETLRTNHSSLIMMYQEVERKLQMYEAIREGADGLRSGRRGSNEKAKTPKDAAGADDVIEPRLFD